MVFRKTDEFHPGRLSRLEVGLFIPDHTQIPVQDVHLGLRVCLFDGQGVLDRDGTAEIAAAPGVVFGSDAVDHDHLPGLSQITLSEHGFEFQLGDHTGVFAVVIRPVGRDFPHTCSHDDR